MRKAAKMRWSGERREEGGWGFVKTEKENIKGKWEGGWTLVNMIILSAAAHSCVQLIRSDNRLRWGTVFICCWFGCILMEAERPCYFFFFFLKEHCVVQRESLLIEANICTRGATLYLIRIWSDRQDPNPLWIWWLNLSIRSSLFVFSFRGFFCLFVFLLQDHPCNPMITNLVLCRISFSQTLIWRYVGWTFREVNTFRTSQPIVLK